MPAIAISCLVGFALAVGLAVTLAAFAKRFDMVSSFSVSVGMMLLYHQPEVLPTSRCNSSRNLGVAFPVRVFARGAIDERPRNRCPLGRLVRFLVIDVAVTIHEQLVGNAVTKLRQP